MRVKNFGPQGPVTAKHVFEAAATSPTPAPVFSFPKLVLKRKCWINNALLPGAVCIRSASSDIKEGVLKRDADARSNRYEKIHTGFIFVEGVTRRDTPEVVTDVNIRSRPGGVRLQTEDEIVHLPVITKLAAAHERGGAICQRTIPLGVV